MQGYRTNTEDTGSLGYNSVCYVTSRIGWVSLKGIYRYRLDVDTTLENCTIPYTYLTKDQPPPSNLDQPPAKHGTPSWHLNGLPDGSNIGCVCVFFPFILDTKFVGRTSRGHTGGRSHRIFHPPSFCGACLNFSREKDSAISFPRRP